MTTYLNLNHCTHVSVHWMVRLSDRLSIIQETHEIPRVSRALVHQQTICPSLWAILLAGSTQRLLRSVCLLV